MNAPQLPVVSWQVKDRFGVERMAPPAHSAQPWLAGGAATRAVSGERPEGTGEVLTLVERRKDGSAVFRRPNGELITAMMAPSSVTNQREQLENYLGGYSPFGFAADMMIPEIPVDKEKGDRRDLSKENAFEVVDTTVGRQGAINEVDLLSELGTYSCREYALASYLPWQTENDAQGNFNVRASLGQMLKWKLALHREVRALTLLTTLTNWASTNRLDLTAVAASKWNDGASKDPRADLQAILRASLQPVTMICMNPDVAFHFLSDTKVIAYMRQMLGDSAPSPEVAAAAAAGDMGIIQMRIPGLPMVCICPSKKLSGGSTVYCLGDDVLCLSVQPNPTDGLRIGSAFAYRTRGRSGSGIQANEYVPEGRGINRGSMFDVGFSEDLLISSNLAGGLIKDVLS